MLIAVSLAALLALPVGAAEAGLDEVDPQQGLEPRVMEAIGPYSGAVEGLGERLLSLLASTLGNVEALGLAAGLRSMGIILAAALLSALAEGEDPGTRLIPLAGVLAITAACAGDLNSMMALGTSTLEQTHNYLTLLLPGLSSLMLSSGAWTGGAVLATGGMVFFDLLQGLVNTVLVPMVYLLVALTAADAALGQGMLEKLRGFVRWLMVSGVKLMMYGFGGFLSMTGLFSGAVDGARYRTLRNAIAGLVPVVGNIVAGAAQSVLGAAQLLKTSVGLYGMLAVLAISLGPFLRLGLHYLILKLTAAVCGLFGAGYQGALVEKLSQAMGFLLALTGLNAILTLLILALCVGGGSGWTG